MPTSVQVTKRTPSADWYQQNIPDPIAEQQSTELGISKDQLYQMYAAYAAQGTGGPGSAADWSQQSFITQGGPGQSNFSQNQQIAPSNAYTWIQNQVNAQKAQAILNPNQGTGGQAQGQAQAQAMPGYWGPGPQWGPGLQMNQGAQAMPGYLGTAAQLAQGATAQPSGVTAAQFTGPQGGQAGGTSMATTAEQIPTSVSIPQWQQWYNRNLGKSILINGQPATIGQDVNPDQLLNYFQTNQVGWGTPQNQPETRALAQMAQIDPVSEAVRQGLGASYLANLGGGPPAPQFGLDLSRGAAAPQATDVQSYLNLYKQIDPQGFAQRQALAGQMGSYLQQAQQQAALGSQLTAGQAREVDQATREAQAARGNVYGTPQLVAEAMTRGQYGIQLGQQRQALLGQALGQQQGYLTSGAGMGDVANQLYNQGYSRYLQGQGQALNTWQAQQNARLQAQGAALGYLGSGQTPLQAGSSYLNMAQQNAAQAAQGGPQYNPSALGQQYTGAGAPSFPQYGLDMSQLAGNWYNNINQANLQAYGLQQAYGQKSGGSAMGAGVGALGGAASGALAGAAAGGIGAIPGALIGAVGGAASGYFK